MQFLSKLYPWTTDKKIIHHRSPLTSQKPKLVRSTILWLVYFCLKIVWFFHVAFWIILLLFLWTIYFRHWFRLNDVDTLFFRGIFLFVFSTTISKSLSTVFERTPIEFSTIYVHLTVSSGRFVVFNPTRVLVVFTTEQYVSRTMTLLRLS